MDLSESVPQPRFKIKKIHRKQSKIWMPMVLILMPTLHETYEKGHEDEKDLSHAFLAHTILPTQIARCNNFESAGVCE